MINEKIDFRAVGFTDAAAEFPRHEIALAMFAAFNGVDIDNTPPAFRYFPNEATKLAWERVANAARLFIEKENGAEKL